MFSVAWAKTRCHRGMPGGRYVDTVYRNRQMHWYLSAQTVCPRDPRKTSSPGRIAMGENLHRFQALQSYNFTPVPPQGKISSKSVYSQEVEAAENMLPIALRPWQPVFRGRRGKLSERRKGSALDAWTH